MRVAAVRMCFPSPSGFGGIGETGKVTGVAADDSDRDVFDMIRWAISRGMILIRLRLWTVNSECAVSRVLRIRICQKGRDKVRKSGSDPTDADAFPSLPLCTSENAIHLGLVFTYKERTYQYR